MRDSRAQCCRRIDREVARHVVQIHYCLRGLIPSTCNYPPQGSVPPPAFSLQHEAQDTYGVILQPLTLGDGGGQSSVEKTQKTPPVAHVQAVALAAPSPLALARIPSAAHHGVAGQE